MDDRDAARGVTADGEVVGTSDREIGDEMAQSAPPGGGSSGSSGRQNTTQRLEAMEALIAVETARLAEEREALRQEYEQLRSEQSQLRREYEDRQRDLFLVSGLDAISTVLENGFEQVIGQLEPLTEFRPPSGETPLPLPTQYRFASLQATQQRIQADSYQVPLGEYDVGFLNDPRDRPDTGAAGSAGYTQEGMPS